MQNRSISDPDPELSDQEGQLTLYQRYNYLIFSYILKHTRTREDAEDITLEVFTAALERNDLADLTPNEQLAWLKRVTHNKLIDSYRKANRFINVNFDIFAETLPDYEEPEQLLLQREEHEQLHRHIQQLTPQQQQVLALRYAHNLPYAEISILLNKSEGAVRQLLARTRLLLRSMYSTHEQKGDR